MTNHLSIVRTYLRSQKNCIHITKYKLKKLDISYSCKLQKQRQNTSNLHDYFLLSCKNKPKITKTVIE